MAWIRAKMAGIIANDTKQDVVPNWAWGREREEQE